MAVDGHDGSRPTPPPGTLGSVLVRGRARLGLDARAMAERLHVSVAVVHALERDDPEALPPGPYARGYLRNYLRLLGHDPEQVLARYEPPRMAAGDWRSRRVPSALLASFADGGPALVLSLLLAASIVAGGFWVSEAWRGETVQAPASPDGLQQPAQGPSDVPGDPRVATTAEP